MEMYVHSSIFLVSTHNMVAPNKAAFGILSSIVGLPLLGSRCCWENLALYIASTPSEVLPLVHMYVALSQTRPLMRGTHMHMACAQRAKTVSFPTPHPKLATWGRTMTSCLPRGVGELQCTRLHAAVKFIVC